VDPGSWAVDWLTRFLSKELTLPCLLRLWDTYFSADEGLDLHVYVCLAILKYYNDQLDDLEHSEILAFLRCIPSMDMDEVGIFLCLLLGSPLSSLPPCVSIDHYRGIQPEGRAVLGRSYLIPKPPPVHFF